MLVHELLDQGEASSPALLGRHAATYARLQENIARYRSFLLQQGIGVGDRVGLFAKNSPEFLYSYFAVASVGAVVVPLNTQLVPREIAYILQDAQAKVLITMTKLPLEEELAAYPAAPTVRQLVMGEIFSHLERSDTPSVPPITGLSEETLCTIIYTSGTTGHPKGAMLSHKNLISNAQAFSEAFPHHSSDRVLCVLPMYHCFAWTVAVLTPLLNGCSIYLQENFALRETLTAIREEELTMVHGIPAMYKLFTQWAQKEDFMTVRLFVSGGSSLPREISQQFTEKTGSRIVEGYGLSEASPVVSLNPHDRVEYCSVGKPRPGVAVRITDEQGQDLPVGEIGELLVQGPNVMLGYYNLPEATADTLRQGWLHTGDMAYMDSDGYLFIVDRLKDMIIASGENIYPREIEELLYAHPGIGEAAVIGIPDELRGTIVRAYVVPREGQTLDVRQVKRYLQPQLAAYKIPREIVVTDNLPKNATGKILKKVLRQQALLSC